MVFLQDYTKVTKIGTSQEIFLDLNQVSFNFLLFIYYTYSVIISILESGDGFAKPQKSGHDSNNIKLYRRILW